MLCRKLLALTGPFLVLCGAITVVLCGLTTLSAAEQSVPELLKQLSNKDASVRASALDALGKLSPKEPAMVVMIVKSVGDPDPTVRRSAINALRVMKPDPEVSLPAMVKVLEEAPPEVAISIVAALAEAGEEVVPRLKIALEHPNARYWAALVAHDLGPKAKDAVPDIIKALLDTKEEEVRRELVLALGAIGPEAKGAVPTLTKLVADKDPAIVIAATYSLGQIGPNAASASDVLKQGMGSKDEFLKVVSAWALAAVNPQDMAIEKQVVPILIAGLVHPDQRGVRAAAAQAIVQLQPDHDVLLPEVLAAVENSSPEVVMESVQALSAAGRDAVPGLAKLLKHEKVRPMIANVLGRMGSQASAAVPTMVEVLPSSDVVARRELLMALGKMGEASAPAVPTIAEQLKAEDEQVRLAAVYALMQIGPAARDAKGAVRQGLASEDALFRTLCAAALVHIDPNGADIAQDAVPLLIVALKHEQPLVRMNAASTLALLKSQAKLALPALKLLAEDKDPQVSAAAKAAIKEIE